MHAALHETIATVWRLESPAIVGALMRLVRDLAVAEELAQDALVAALEHWPADGLPDKPGAWLMTTAKRRALDHLRHRRLSETRHGELAADLAAMEALTVPDFSDTLDERRAGSVADDLLRLVFTACHPVLTPDARVALTLRLLGGLSTQEIARAFLAAEPAIAQRIVRAKRRLAEADVPYEVPRGAELAPRLASVLEVVYLIFNEGYTATSGADWMRPALCMEALRLGRMLAELAPTEPEVAGLLALMELQASRTAARTDAQGQPVLLAEQDRTRWDRLLIRRGLAALARGEQLAGATRGPYVLQAAIAACHARATRWADTDWSRIAALYGELAQVAPSPVVELNRAVAVAQAQGPAAGLAIVEGLLDHPAMARYHWLPSVLGDLLFKLGRRAEAREAFERAAALAGNERERELLLARAHEAQG
ncbi:RNA polymerase sigma factor [Hydrogenophaga sp. OTU3427]|uniref:RNA polymerase sigma factor n=1 Tax=Hydrogenophaga sp. OTU3427 TaxID=3043856 RepID=UPI00313CC193